MNLSIEQRERATVLVTEAKRRKEVYRYKSMFPMMYDFQRDMIRLTATKKSTLLMAANRIGKTFSGVYVDAIHLLGDYPDDWDGHRFDHAPLCWLLGYSGEKTRDLLQTPLFGRLDGRDFAGGLIPAERIIDYRTMTGTTGAMREVRVQHSSGGISTCQFWSYTQGQHALMGDSVDWYHIDEEPKDQTIYPQVVTRTLTGDKGKGGRGILTFTPENGRTDTVISFMDEPSASQGYVQAGWDDAPHLDEQAKADMLTQYPAYQRDMRSKGVPMLGHGRIYDLSEDSIKCDPFKIPDHWVVINGMDFGWDHPQAHIQLVIDLDSNDYYVTQAWKKSQTAPEVAWATIKPWADPYPTAWPLDGLQTEKNGSAKQQKDYYEAAGFNMLPRHATFQDGSNSVEAGLYEIRDLMLKGKFKVFHTNREFFNEFNQYHRNDKGNIAKTLDDILDAVRYAYMMRRFAEPWGNKFRYDNAFIESSI